MLFGILSFCSETMSERNQVCGLQWYAFPGVIEVTLVEKLASQVKDEPLARHVS